jgi:hypothetical protein
MSIVTTYTCDRCGHSQNDSDQMWNVVVSITHNVHSEPGYYDGRHRVLWCRGCTEHFGLVPARRPAGTPEPILPTLEDMIREIVREEMPR